MTPYFLIDHMARLENILMYDFTKLPFSIGMLCSCQYESFLPMFAKINYHNVLKICDSGAFAKNGHNYNTYEKLLPMYQSLNIHYGVMLDYRNDKYKTIDSAREGIKEYKKYNYSFELLAVCQGRYSSDTSEWIECYKAMYSMGYNYFAIGGTIVKNSSMFYRIDPYLTQNIITDIRDIDKQARIFALGFLSPSRVKYMLENNIDGDSKSWILDFTTKGKGTRPQKDIERINNLVKKYFNPIKEYNGYV